MKRNTKVKCIVSALLVAMLQACGEGSEGVIGTGLNISGAAQKGPFILGSSILVNSLSASGEPTASTVVTETKDNLGNFSFQMDEPAVVQLVASGYNFNELTGELSNSTLTLRAIYAATGSENQKAYINVLTHLIQPRVIALIKSGKDASTAISQAQNELIKALQTVLPVKDGIAMFTDLDLFNSDKSNNKANAYLLALSASFYQMATNSSVGKDNVDAELTSNLNSLADDLGKDGTVENSTILTALTEASRQIDPREIESNLKQRSASVSNSVLEVANMDLVLDADGDGIVNVEDDDANGDGKLDSETKGLFTRHLSGKGYSLNRIQQTSDNGYIAVGSVVANDSAGHQIAKDPLLLKLDENGYQEFARKIKFDKETQVLDVMQVVDNEYLIIGVSNEYVNSEEVSTLHILKVDQNAKILWEKSYEGVGDYTDFSQKTKLYKSGMDYIVKTVHVERSFDSIDYTPILIKISANGELVWRYDFDKKLEDFVSVNSLFENSDGSLDLVGTIYTTKEFSSTDEATSHGYYMTVGGPGSTNDGPVLAATYKVYTATLSGDAKQFDHKNLPIQSSNKEDAYGFRMQDKSMILYTYGQQENSSSNLFKIDESSNVVWEKYIEKIYQRSASPLAVDYNQIAIFHYSPTGTKNQFSVVDSDGEFVIDSKEIPSTPSQTSNSSGNLNSVIATADKGYLYSFVYDSTLGSNPLLVKSNSAGDTIGE